MKIRLVLLEILENTLVGSKIGPKSNAFSQALGRNPEIDRHPLPAPERDLENRKIDQNTLKILKIQLSPSPFFWSHQSQHKIGVKIPRNCLASAGAAAPGVGGSISPGRQDSTRRGLLFSRQLEYSVVEIEVNFLTDDFSVLR